MKRSGVRGHWWESSRSGTRGSELRGKDESERELAFVKETRVKGKRETIGKVCGDSRSEEERRFQRRRQAREVRGTSVRMRQAQNP